MNQVASEMAEKIFILKLIPPRPTFANDMNAEEREVMQQHVVYWKDLSVRGVAIIFGPVLDPKGVYGIGIVRVKNEMEVQEITKKDPANGLNTYEYYPMMADL